jgi:hypothetical protein
MKNILTTADTAIKTTFKNLFGNIGKIENNHLRTIAGIGVVGGLIFIYVIILALLEHYVGTWANVAAWLGLTYYFIYNAVKK